MSLMLADYALGAYVRLARVTEVLGLLLRVHEAEFVNEAFFTVFSEARTLLGSRIATSTSSSMYGRTHAAKLVGVLFVVDVV